MEAWINVAIGFGINFVVNLILLPLFFHIHVDLLTNFYMGLVYTVISVARSYVIRRFFNSYIHLFSERVSTWIK